MYLFIHLQYLNKYLSVGPPVYFILDGELDFANYSIQNKVCGTVDCDATSLGTQIYLSSLQSNRYFKAFSKTQHFR